MAKVVRVVTTLKQAIELERLSGIIDGDERVARLLRSLEEGP